MHDRFNFLIEEDPFHGGFIAQIRVVHGHIGREGSTVAIGEIVEHHGAVTGSGELAHTMAADVTGASDDENVHR